ncbi:MFS transporter [uncultured Shewanella sp.]|uniref:MFS transporter n=1 Tax=uncultured Shewanella sp. TaxID=173975 RepID=UPI002622D98E|nr:MFS transporter [uncultured Shewanella sp.]
MIDNPPLTKILPLAWIFVIYEYTIRVSDSVILTPLSLHLQLDIADLSALSSAYYFTYVIFMLPAGILIDKFGLYKTWIYAISLFTSGCAIFAWAPNLNIMIIARILMGIGSNFATVGTLALVIHSKRRGLLIGISLALASFGAFLGQGPWRLLSDLLNSWQTAYWLATAFSFSFLILWIYFGQQSQHLNINVGFKRIFPSLKQLICSPTFILLGFYIGAINSPQSVFSALWGTSFMHTAYSLPFESSAFFISSFSIGSIFGGILLGLIGDLIINKHFKYTPIILCGCGLVSASIISIIINSQISLDLLLFMLFLAGLITNANAIVFAYIGSFFSTLPQATTQASTNMCNMAGGTVLQLLIGMTLAQLTHHQLIEKTTKAEWQTVLYILPSCIVITSLSLLLLYVFQKSSNKKSAS